MLFRSTRSEAEPVVAERALLSGLAPDGGLYVPVAYPSLDPTLMIGGDLSYPEIAYRVIRPYFDSLPEAALREAVEAAAARFDDARVAPLVCAGELRILELFHGPTLAFKDLALTLFGSLLSMARELVGMKEELLVIVATSGDTGSAALEGLEGVPGVRVVVLYPAIGVSQVQRLQMTTHDAKNSLVLGVRGNFDDAQRVAKHLLSDPDARRRFALRGVSPGSANSINVGRLIPQVAYYVAAWRGLRDAGGLGWQGAFDAVVPSGNFGNVLAARYAKYMGLPLGDFLVATNKNRVLADFLDSGTYDRNRPFHVTSSPSMDILVSSNLERLVFEATGRDTMRSSALMASLAGSGRYELGQKEREAFRDFRGASSDEAETAAEIRRVFDESGYLLDPHTATAVAALRRSGRAGPAIVTATASPFKFATTVASALGIETGKDEFLTLERLAEKARLPYPRQLLGLSEKPERHTRILDTVDIPDVIDDWLRG
ncbi:MAG: threonine synthase [Spirochaetota bacterium]